MGHRLLLLPSGMLSKLQQQLQHRRCNSARATAAPCSKHQYYVSLLTCCLSCSTSDTILQKRLQHQAEVLSHSSPAVGVRNCFCCFWCEAVDHSVGGQQRRADHSGVCRCPIGVVALLQQPALRWRCLQEALTNLTLQQQQLPGAVLACPIVVAACRMVPAAAADGYVHNQG